MALPFSRVPVPDRLILGYPLLHHGLLAAGNSAHPLQDCSLPFV
ncbi:hypothetical protein [Falsigemmobacter intermedius]